MRLNYRPTAAGDFCPAIWSTFYSVLPQGQFAASFINVLTDAERAQMAIKDARCTVQLAPDAGPAVSNALAFVIPKNPAAAPAQAANSLSLRVRYRTTALSGVTVQAEIRDPSGTVRRESKVTDTSGRAAFMVAPGSTVKVKADSDRYAFSPAEYVEEVRANSEKLVDAEPIPSWAVVQPTATGAVWYVQNVWPNNRIVGSAAPFGPAGAQYFYGDLSGDGIPDQVAAASESGALHWYVKDGRSGAVLLNSLAFGSGAGVPVPADYNGDGRVDLGVWHPADGRWFAISLEQQVLVSTVQLGARGMIPVPADFNGDGKADPALFAPQTGSWLVQGFPQQRLGQPGDMPLAADINGDGRAELVAYRPSTRSWSAKSPVTGELLADNMPWGPAGTPLLMDVSPVDAAGSPNPGAELLLYAAGPYDGAFMATRWEPPQRRFATLTTPAANGTRTPVFSEFGRAGWTALAPIAVSGRN